MLRETVDAFPWVAEVVCFPGGSLKRVGVLVLEFAVLLFEFGYLLFKGFVLELKLPQEGLLLVHFAPYRHNQPQPGYRYDNHGDEEYQVTQAHSLSYPVVVVSYFSNTVSRLNWYLPLLFITAKSIFTIFLILLSFLVV